MQPKIGQELFLHITSIDENEANILYKSRIADMDKDTMSIEVPIEVHSGRFKPLFSGDNLSVHFISDGGVKNYFNSEVIGSKEDGVRLVVLKRPAPDAISREQRRNFLRVPAQMEIAVQADALQFVGMTEDLSGGGISFMCEKLYDLREGQLLSCWLLLTFRSGQIEHIPFIVEVVRMKDYSDLQQLVMAKYVDITESDQQKIVRFCFERQLDFRKS